MPAAGKSTVAEELARRLRLPLIARDEIKESLYETLGADTPDASGALGGAAFALIFALAKRMLGSGVSVIVEANFFRQSAPEFAALPEHRLVQVHCAAPLAVLMERYASRARHAGHHDAEKINELPGRFESGVHDALELRGELIELDTTGQVDFDSLCARIGPTP